MSKNIKQLADLQPDRTNANKGTPRGRGMVEASLRETGAGRSIVVDKDGETIAGNKTLEAWADIGGEIIVVPSDGTKLVVVQRTDLDLSDDTGPARKLAYYDNRAGEVGLEWDAERLLADLNAGVDLADIFRDDELDELLAGLQPEPEPVSDPGAQVAKAEELRGKWGVQSGDLWQLGEHRLICGDCTDAAVVARVMGGEKAVCMWTDPPYGVSYVGKTKDALTIENDGAEGLLDLLTAAFGVADSVVLAEGSPFYIAAPPGPPFHDFATALIRVGWKWHETLAWVKNSMVLGYSDYHYKHEAVFYGWKGKNRFWYAGRDQVSVFEIDRPSRSEDHPTMKPPELVIAMLENSTKAVDLVYEPFDGSGTTLMACEALHRRCRAVEISPAYVAVALERWATATGREPVRVG